MNKKIHEKAKKMTEEVEKKEKEKFLKEIKKEKVKGNKTK